MYLKRYTIAAFILILSIGLYVNFYVTQDSIGIDFFGIPLPSLSVATWVSISLFLLYLASLFHMSFYTLLGNFKLRKYEKDYEKMIDSITDAYLGKVERNHRFKTPRYQLLGSLLDNTTMFPHASAMLQTDNEKINSVLKLIESVKNGEVVDLKKLALSPENPIVHQNDRNRYIKEEISAEDILSAQQSYNKDLCEEAYLDFVKTSPLYAIEKYKSFLTKESLFIVLSRINSDNNRLEVPNDSLILMFNSLELQSKDFIEASSLVSHEMIPEQRMKLFESLSDEDEMVMDAYLYTLFDLEMIEAADVILHISQPNEFLNFKAYRALKECDKHFSINLFI